MGHEPGGAGGWCCSQLYRYDSGRSWSVGGYVTMQDDLEEPDRPASAKSPANELIIFAPHSSTGTGTGSRGQPASSIAPIPAFTARPAWTCDYSRIRRLRLARTFERRFPVSCGSPVRSREFAFAWRTGETRPDDLGSAQEISWRRDLTRRASTSAISLRIHATLRSIMPPCASHSIVSTPRYP